LLASLITLEARSSGSKAGSGLAKVGSSVPRLSITTLTGLQWQTEGAVA
jgi:hypothetical protein